MTSQPRCEERTRLDTVLRTLSSERVRFICYYVESNNTSPINVLDLAREVAAWESGIPASQIPAETVARYAITLHYTVLPKLERIGFVDYDRQKGKIQHGVPPDSVRRIIDVCRSLEVG